MMDDDIPEDPPNSYVQMITLTINGTRYGLVGPVVFAPEFNTRHVDIDISEIEFGEIMSSTSAAHMLQGNLLPKTAKQSRAGNYPERSFVSFLVYPAAKVRYDGPRSRLIQLDLKLLAICNVSRCGKQARFDRFPQNSLIGSTGSTGSSEQPGIESGATRERSER